MLIRKVCFQEYVLQYSDGACHVKIVPWAKWRWKARKQNMFVLHFKGKLTNTGKFLLFYFAKMVSDSSDSIVFTDLYGIILLHSKTLLQRRLFKECEVKCKMQK